jgi:hypothetical protein
MEEVPQDGGDGAEGKWNRLQTVLLLAQDVPGFNITLTVA